MILLVDNYDSFVHNLARYIRLCGAETIVMRNDAITLADITRMNPQGIVISPGPCGPDQAGISLNAIAHFGPAIPVLGVCLGHQAIVQAYGGNVAASGKPCHGMATSIHHDSSVLFDGVPSPCMAGRYHSLVTTLPAFSPLRVTAKADDGTIMAVQHETHPVFGVQFHPESILTEHGMRLVQNFIGIARKDTP